MSMLPLSSKVECPDCRGRGSIMLLIRTVACTKCGGKGVVPISVHEIPVGNLPISQRAKACLRQLKASCVKDIVRLSEKDLRGNKEMTDAALAEIKKALAELGLSLRPSEPIRASATRP